MKRLGNPFVQSTGWIDARLLWSHLPYHIPCIRATINDYIDQTPMKKSTYLSWGKQNRSRFRIRQFHHDTIPFGNGFDFWPCLRNYCSQITFHTKIRWTHIIPSNWWTINNNKHSYILDFDACCSRGRHVSISSQKKIGAKIAKSIFQKGTTFPLGM